jgi:large subunit ribosomal protein L7/L12
VGSAGKPAAIYDQLLRTVAGLLHPAGLLERNRTMSAVAELGDRLAKLTIAEAVELKKYLKEKYEIEPAGGGAMMMAMPQGPTTTGPTPPPAEATEFNVILEGADAAKKINVIKVVRELTGQGLAEAKATVEGAPKPIKEGVDKKTADEVKKKLEDAGGKVSVKPV